MFKRRLPPALLAALLILLAVANALGQAKDKLSLNQAVRALNDDRQIQVFFGSDLPDETTLKKTSNWVVFDITQDGFQAHVPTSVPTVLTDTHVVALQMGSEFPTGDLTGHKVVIQFKQGNLPSVNLGRSPNPNAGRTFIAAKGKDAADIYFSGEAATAREAKPEYSIEAKAAYLFNLTPKGSKVDYGSIGVKGTFESGSASSIDPDSITVGGTYRKLFVVGTASGFGLNSDFIGFELDKKNETRNLVSELSVNYVPPAATIGNNKVASIDFMAGVEGGHNYKNSLVPDGIGNFYRWKFGANTYFTVFRPFKSLARITYNTEYKLRLPQSAEIFSRTIDGEELKSLTKKPRHYVATDLDFMFTDAVGIALKHRYGSLPPAFKLVDNKVSVGLVVQFQQVNK